jgi:hypothetical protein
MLSQLPDTAESPGPSERLAQVAISADDLAQRHQIRWHTGQDDLDSFRYAVVRVDPSVQPFRLLSYTHDPDQSILVLGRVTPTLDEDLAKLFDALNVSTEQVLGRRAPASPEPTTVLRRSSLTKPARGRTLAARSQLVLSRLRPTEPGRARLRRRTKPGAPTYTEGSVFNDLELLEARVTAEMAAWMASRVEVNLEEMSYAETSVPERLRRERVEFDFVMARERAFLWYELVLRGMLVLLIPAIVALSIVGIWQGATAVGALGLALVSTRWLADRSHTRRARGSDQAAGTKDAEDAHS